MCLEKKMYAFFLLLVSTQVSETVLLSSNNVVDRLYLFDLCVLQ